MSLPAADDRLLDATATKLKIIQRDGKKVAVRLERIFWSQLQEFAREDKASLSRFVFKLLDAGTNVDNRTSYLRCYCLDRMRKKQPLTALMGPAFDMLALVSACPAPVVILTNERKIAAFNPAFSAIVRNQNPASSVGQREINLVFSESFARIQTGLIQNPTSIPTYQIGLQIGGGMAQQFRARFALVDRSKGMSSLVTVFLET
jgi:predicted DNA-binding ribbon-helix-helix protein